MFVRADFGLSATNSFAAKRHKVGDGLLSFSFRLTILVSALALVLPVGRPTEGAKYEDSYGTQMASLGS